MSDPITVDKNDVAVPEPEGFKGNILIQLFDQDGNLKDERRAGGE